MATTKITDLTAYTDPVNTDVLPIVDVTSDVTKKVSIANVMKNASLGSAAAPGISFDGDPNTGIYSPGADQVAISTGGSERLFVDASGSVINSTNASGGVGLNITNQGDGGTTTTPYAFINARLNPTRNGGEIRFGRESNYGSAANADSYMAFYTAANDVNNERLRITSAGQLSFIGAGTSGSPAVSFNGSAPVNSLVVNSSGNVGVGAAAPDNLFHINQSATSGFNQVIQRITTAAGGSFFIRCSDLSAAAPSWEIYTGSSEDIRFSPGAAEKLRITSNGEFEFTGAGTAGSTQAVYFSGSAPTNSLVIDSSGNAGIKTQTPSSEFHVVGGSLYSAIKTGSTVYIGNSGTGIHGRLGVISGNAFGIQTAWTGDTNGYNLALNPYGGNVGIGTSSPGSLLTVQASGTQQALFSARANAGAGGGMVLQTDASDDGLFRLYDSAGAIKVQLDTDGGDNYIALGNVGVGTTTPQQLLHIAASTKPIFRIDNTNTALTNGADIGSVDWYINDASSGGTGVGGEIALVGDGTMAGGQVATRMEFRTYNVSSLNTGLTINKDGKVGVGSNATAPDTTLYVRNTAAFDTQIKAVQTDTTGGVCAIRALSSSAMIDLMAGGSTYATNYMGADEAGLITQVTGDSMRFNVGGSYCRWTFGSSETARLTSSGQLLVGTSTARSNFAGNTATPLVQIEGVTAATASSSVVRGAADATGPTFNLGKTRGASVNQHTAVVSGDQCGVITFQGADGTNLLRAAQIAAEVDNGAAGTALTGSEMPGRLVFSTTSDSASSPTERVRITSTGRLICGRDARDATLESTDQFSIEGNGYAAFHALNGTAYTIGQNSNSRALRIGSGSGWATTGVSLAAGGTSWGTYSDERLKTDIVELSDCLGSIKDIRCVSYRLTEVDEPDSKKRLGVIAQDLVGKYDEAINESRRSDDDETEYLSVQYTDLVPVLIKALQEASSKIEVLEARLTALESV